MSEDAITLDEAIQHALEASERQDLCETAVSNMNDAYLSYEGSHRENTARSLN